MTEKIKSLWAEIESAVAVNEEELEALRIRLVGKKGIIPALFEEFKSASTEEKRETGKLLNDLKNKAQEKLQQLKDSMGQSVSGKASDLDLTLPADELSLGSRHPINIVRNRIIEIFARQGFTVSYGPEVEDDWHNFTALNFPEEHPARDMQDTFFIEKKPDIALRTHTSSVQIRVMENEKPPLKTLAPGRVFRNEAVSARAHCIFHQIEGLYVDKNVSLADLKQTLLYFSREMFGKNTEIRLRPSFFPFTEPSAEMDISCMICGGKGCNICKYSGWVEILGCGMVDPSVLENCGIDSKTYSGYAFGMGVERIAMLQYQIKDIRLLFENDIRFLKQFSSAI